MPAPTTISSRRHGRFRVALVGLTTAGSLLTCWSQPARGEPAAQPGVKVLANPPAATDSPRPAGPVKAASPAGLIKRISLDLRQIDVLAVLKFLAEQGDFNIVPGKNVGGRVTLSVKDITIQDALDIIALTNELAYVVQSRVIHVMTEADYQRLFGAAFADQREVRTVNLQFADAGAVATVLGNVKSAVGKVVADPQSKTIILIDVPEKVAQMVSAAEGIDRAAQLHTHAFELRYAKAADVKAEVEKALTPKLGAVRMDKRTNTLVVTDLGSQMQEIRRVISAFDRKTREVVIQARILEVRLEDSLAMGVDWEALLKTIVDVNVKQFFPVTPALTAAGRITLGTFSSDKFRAVLELLQTVGKTNILSTPQIAVVENEEAKILVGTREAYVTSAVTQTSTAATTAEQVTFVDVGLQLKVLPSINDAGLVTMKIKPEVSSVNRFLTTAAGNVIPIVDTSAAESTVMIKDGNTLVIAGLMKDEKIRTEKKFPILADIPVLGVLFRSRQDRVAKTELVFFLTPTIITGAESVGVTPGLRREEEKPAKQTEPAEENDEG
jgi:type II secretory pathway component GspD/PulD (secretin)